VKQVRLHGPEDVRIDEVPEPEAGPRDMVVRVAACGICGSDVGYVKLGGVAGRARGPLALGHELAGVIEQVGREVDGLAAGARVVVHPGAAGNRIGNGGPEGGFAPRLLVRNAAAGGNVFAIPDGMPFEVAALAEPLGVGMNAAERSEARAGEKAVVFGAGPIGLAAVATLVDRGVADVIAVDLSERRLELARALGARATLNPGQGDVWKGIRALHGESPVLGAPMAATDAYVEASGAAPVIGEILSHAKAEARLSVVALHRQPVPVSFLLVMLKQLTLRGAMEYPADFSQTLALLGRRDLSPLITHRFPLARFAEALAVARDASAGGKVMIEP
jgi:(R,R)-butanediol dehydrogenase / meso-butanediol dehydrogenase / diacetyl reductase